MLKYSEKLVFIQYSNWWCNIAHSKYYIMCLPTLQEAHIHYDN